MTPSVGEGILGDRVVGNENARVSLSKPGSCSCMGPVPHGSRCMKAGDRVTLPRRCLISGSVTDPGRVTSGGGQSTFVLLFGSHL